MILELSVLSQRWVLNKSGLYVQVNGRALEHLLTEVREFVRIRAHWDSFRTRSGRAARNRSLFDKYNATRDSSDARDSRGSSRARRRITRSGMPRDRRNDSHRR